MAPIKVIPLNEMYTAVWGKQGENNAVQLSYDLTGWENAWPDGGAAVAFRRCDGKEYAHTFLREGNTLLIPILDYDTEIAGSCAVVISWIDNGNESRSVVIDGRINASIVSLGNTPSAPEAGIIEQVNAAAVRAEEAAESALSASGYYTPSVTQPDDTTMRVAYTPSTDKLPALEAVDITLPKGERGEPGQDAEPYTLPVASADTLGGVKVGEGLEVTDDGTVNTEVKKADIDQLSEENAVFGTELDMRPKPSKNLNVTPYDKSYSNYGITITVNDDNSIDISGTPTTDIFWPSISKTPDKRWPISAGIYTLSGASSPFCSITLFLYTSQTDSTPASEYIQGGSDGAPVKVVVQTDCWAIIRLNILKTWGEGNTTLYPQLEAGEAATEYVSPWTGDLYSKRFADLESAMSELDATVNPLVVPDYYFEDGYLPGKVARINELMRTCSNNGDVFAFITDTHWEKNAGKSPALLNYIRKNTHIDRLFGGGDYIDAANSNTEMYDVSTIFRDAWAGPIYFTLGNHDYMGDAAYRGTDASLYWDWNSYGTERVGNLSRNYYYVDNPQMKMRYIVLNRYIDRGEENAEINGLNEEQRTWLQNVALDVETDWTVLVFVHDLYRFIYGDDGYTATMSLNYSDSNATVTILDAFVESGGTVAGIFCGEAHVDMVNYTPGGIPVITTTCDKNTGTEAALPIADQFEERLSGTIKEQVIDVMVIDKTNRTITAVRIGYQARNSVEGNYGELVEERTITY